MIRAVVAVAVAALLAPACVRTEAGETGGDVPDRFDGVLVGAFNFSESAVLAEVYAQVLEGAGVHAEVLPEVASREIMEPALEQGEVDLVPEYLGTALTFLGEHEAAAGGDRAGTLALLERDFAERNVVVLQPAPGQNRNEVVVTERFAEEHDLETIGDLARVDQDAVFGGPPECPARPLCLVGLEDVYGLRFREFAPFDSGGPATVAALTGGEVDVALVFTTNPQIARNDLVVLEDNRHLQPPENIVPVLRSDVAEALGQVTLSALDGVTRRLSTDALRELNGMVEIDGMDPAGAAREWLDDQGLTREDA